MALVRFSQRKSLSPVRVDVQKDSIDSALRSRLWSALCVLFFDLSEEDFRYQHQENSLGIRQRLWIHFFNRTVDTLPQQRMEGFQSAVRDWFLVQAKWYEVYDFVEAVAGELKGKHAEQYVSLMNAFLAQDQSAYRFIGSRLTDITSEEEIAAIEGAIADSHPLKGVRRHLETALAFLTDRNAPDFRNAVKESISAVESMCQALTADSSATLGKAIKRLEDSGITLHPALVRGWSQIYGYTSDAGGIRHALTDEPTITRAEAKYMLVTCSAFVSLLTENAITANIALNAGT